MTGTAFKQLLGQTHFISRTADVITRRLQSN